MAFYPWVVIAHVALVILAFGAHGVSAFAMFRVKRETDRARIGAILDLSNSALVSAGIGLIAAVVLGIIAAAMAGYFGRLWPWASIGVVVVAWISMTPMAAGPMADVRQALGQPSRRDKKGETLARLRCGALGRASHPEARGGRRPWRRGHRRPRLADGGEAVLTERVEALPAVEPPARRRSNHRPSIRLIGGDASRWDAN